MAGSTEQFFDDVARRGYETWMSRIEGRLRFDLRSGPSTQHWLVAIQAGKLSLSRESAEADGVIEADRDVFDRLAAGETRPIAAFLRNEITVRGSFRYLLVLDRLLPIPAGRGRRTIADGGRR